MWKFITIAVCLFLLYKLFTGDRKNKQTQAKKETEKMKATGELVKDPACGHFVSVDSEIRIKEGDTVHRFCSYECRDKYLQQIEEQGKVEG